MAGRKPIEMRSLDHSDREWFMALHELREGVPLPLRPLEHWLKPDAKVRRRPRQLERMNTAEYWADLLSQDPPRSRQSNWQPPRLSAVRDHVDRLRHDEIEWLKLRSDSERIQARSAGLKVWDSLWRARTIPALADACKRWIGLHRDLPWEEDPIPIPRGGTSNVYPIRILDHAPQFLAMKRDRRFPKSEQADASRIDYLARGMAGIELGVSPLTAVERLRNLSHSAGGPLWNAETERCVCWRCSLLKERDKFYQLLGEA